jgi:hypothetical protein
MSLLRVNSLGGGSGGAYIQRPLGLWVAAGGHERVIGPPGGDDRGYASVDPSSWMVSIQCLSCMLIFHSTCICAPARLVQTFVPRHAVTFCHTHTHVCYSPTTQHFLSGPSPLSDFCSHFSCHFIRIKQEHTVQHITCNIRTTGKN